MTILNMLGLLVIAVGIVLIGLSYVKQEDCEAIQFKIWTWGTAFVALAATVGFFGSLEYMFSDFSRAMEFISICSLLAIPGDAMLGFAFAAKLKAKADDPVEQIMRERRKEARAAAAQKKRQK